MRFPFPCLINGRKVTTESFMHQDGQMRYRAITWDAEGLIFEIWEHTDVWLLREIAQETSHKHCPMKRSY